MEKNISNDQIYKTSLYGRFGYFVMTLVLLLVGSLLLGLGYKLLSNLEKWYDIFSGILFFSIGLVSMVIIIHNLYNLFSWKKRFILTNEQLEYYGCFRKIKINFNDIKEMYTSHHAQAYVYIQVLTLSGKSYSMDVSGLKPNYSILVNEIEKRRNETFNATINQNNQKEL